MRNLIINYSRNMQIDHIYHDNWDNRKEKLRIATSSQNCMNQKTYKNSTSGYKGINWSKKRNKWCVRIQFNKKRICLGFFDNLEDAIKCRQNGEIKYHGEFRYKENNSQNA